MFTDQPVIGIATEDGAKLGTGEEECSERIGESNGHIQQERCLNML